MIDTHRDHKLTAPDTSFSDKIEEQEVARVTPLSSWSQRLWRSMKSYPLPWGALTLLLVSLLLWLVGRPELAQWLLLMVVLLGGLPLLWETVQQFLHREFSVDLIALLAIIGSLLLGEYLAGAFVVLMLSGGEALEAYALRRARSSLSALAQRAPQTAHIWQDEELMNVPAEAVEVGYAASVEQLSTHILARAIVEAAEVRELPLSLPNDFEEIFGKGVQGRVPRSAAAPSIEQDDMVMVAVGSRTFMRRLDVDLPPMLLDERERRTARGQMYSFVALNGRVVGLIVLEDVPRAELLQLVPGLKKEGIQQTVLLTGDSEVVAQQVGQVAQVDRIVARCMPEEKVHIVKELASQDHRVLMVGDGVNDAPALATATIGMALGAQGLTAAASAADAILLSTDILHVVTAVHLGRRVMHIALQGIWIGMGLSVVAMLFAAWGYIPPATGAILQEGIDVIVILNALRVGRIKT